MTDKTTMEPETKPEASEETTESQETTERSKPETQAGTPEEPESETEPEPDADKGTLFDMRSKAEIAEEKRQANPSESQKKTEAARKEGEEKRKEQERKKKEEENRVYDAGTKLRYVGHLGRENRELNEPMTKKQIIEDLQDDYPEVTLERAKFRYDKEKDQIVITMGSFDKGRG